MRVVILAAGKGKRMNHELPKVLIALEGKPMLSHLLYAVEKSGVDSKPAIVVAPGNIDIIKQSVGDNYDYVVQKEQLGTGDAVRSTRALLEGKTDVVMVLYGDHPFLKPETIKTLRDFHRKEGTVLTMMTISVPDFEGWRKPFYDFGRVIRDGQGEVVDIIEKKDTTPDQLKIREVNPSFFCFRADWLWPNLEKLTNKNAQGEYYLTDLVRIAIQGGERIASVDVNPQESIGVNTPEHLALANTLVT